MSIEIRSVFPTLPKTTRGRPLVINGDPKGKNILYCNGLSVVTRNILEPGLSEIYTEHSVPVNVAKYSPSRFYIASADQSGKVRIWDTVNETHILANEFQPLGGAIKDLAWSHDNQRIVAVGEGREKFGHVFDAQSGTSRGEIVGQTKPLNSCDFRLDRPFRIATASEDYSTALFAGPPFKGEKKQTVHTNFVNVVRYSPDGSVFVSGGADGRAFVYDGKSGEVKGQLGDPAHSGGIYALSFAPDSERVLTASGDKSCKIFNLQGEMLNEFKMGTRIEDQQVSCLWQNDDIISVSLSGFINFLDPENPTQPKKIIKGHNKPITALTVSEDKRFIYTSGTDGLICEWDETTGENEMFSGKPQSSQVEAMKLVDGKIFSVSMDDTIMCSDVASKTYGDSVKLPSQPKGMDTVAGGFTVVACINHVVVYKDGQIVFSHNVPMETTCVAVHPKMAEVAVGTAGKELGVQIYSVSGNTLVEGKQLLHVRDITALAYSPDGAYLAVSDVGKAITVYDVPEHQMVVKDIWTRHAAKITSLDWSPNSQYLASGGLDNRIYVFEVNNIHNHKVKNGAHPKGNITNVRWLDNESLVTVSMDSNTKIWNVTHNAAQKKA